MSVNECLSISISLSDSVPECDCTSRRSPPLSARVLRTLTTSTPRTLFGCSSSKLGI